MIHSARPTVYRELCFRLKFCFVLLDFRSGDGRTDNTCKTMITTSRDCGSAEWINKLEKLKCVCSFYEPFFTVFSYLIFFYGEKHNWMKEGGRVRKFFFLLTKGQRG